MIRRLIGRTVAIANSDAATLFVATFAIGWGLEQLHKMAKARTNQVAALDSAIAERRGDFDELGRLRDELRGDLIDAGVIKAEPVPVSYPARQDLDAGEDDRG